MLLTARNLSKTYGPRTLFRGITLGLGDDERVGLIGANGSGKSTLLKIFAGAEQADEGVVESRRGLVVGYVPQADSFDAELTCLEVVSEAVGGHAHDDHERETKARILLDRAGFVDVEQVAGTLSGGWRKRLAVARELAKEPDLLLMDEPTNHLDVEGIEWLEDLIAAERFGTLIVSHDRRFLEETANRIIELSAQYPEGYLSTSGTYTDFVLKREEFLVAQAGRQQAVASAVRREVAWLQRGAKARTTKAKGRIERAGEMMAELEQLRQRNALAAGAAAGIDFTAGQRQTRKMVELIGVSKSLGGRELFRDVSLVLGPGIRLGLLGPNGSGKSTLIRLLTGKLAPDKGTVKVVSNDLRVVVFDQHRKQLDPESTLRRALSPAGDNLIFQGQPLHVTGWAKRFLFRSEQLDMPVSELSGGEQARVLIAQLMLMPADVLILDEPTNDLDISTLDVLEESLEEFPGAVVMVTHDRYLLDRVSTSILSLDGTGRAEHYAELAQWERARETRAKLAADEARAATDKARAESEKKRAVEGAGVATAPVRKVRLSWKEQKELEGIEAAIHLAEAEVARLQKETDDPKVLADHVRSRDAFTLLGTAQAKAEQLYARWAELEGKA